MVYIWSLAVTSAWMDLGEHAELSPTPSLPLSLHTDQQYIATSSYDRTFKLWEKEQ